MNLRQRAMFIIQRMRIEGYLKGEMVDRCAEALEALDQLSEWEYQMIHAVGPACSVTKLFYDRIANGWEPHLFSDAMLILRRRKPVSKIAAESEAE